MAGSFRSRNWWYRKIWRPIRLWWQRRTRGWDDSETWNLDWRMIEWLVPRLKRYRELNNGFPGGMTEDAWDAALDEMIWALEWSGRDHEYSDKVAFAVDAERARSGLLFLVYHLRDLWW